MFHTELISFICRDADTAAQFVAVLGVRQEFQNKDRGADARLSHFLL